MNSITSVSLGFAPLYTNMISNIQRPGCNRWQAGVPEVETAWQKDIEMKVALSDA